MELFILLISCVATTLIGGWLSYIYLRPRIIATQELDASTLQQNEEIKSDNIRLMAEYSSLSSSNTILFTQNERLTQQNEVATEKLNNLNSSILRAEKQAQEAADLFYASRMEVAQEKLVKSLQEENQKYQDNILNFQQEYDTAVSDMLETYHALSENLANLRALNDAAVAAAKRSAEMNDQINYYRIQLTQQDIDEIKLLRSVEPHLRDKEPLNKIIWKCYYEKPTTDLIGRVVGTGVKTGIYKITEISTGKCYVGQAVNLSERWKQHIKRGMGAETPTRNKLYPAMIAAGPENFTFEVIEICDRAALDAREDYWQDYFKAKEFGYSIK